MNKRILKRYSLGFLCLIGSLTSCSLEQPANDSTLSAGKSVEVRLQVKAPAGGGAATNPESAINRLRMVVFGSIGATDPGKLILNKYYPTVPTDNLLKEIITSGRRDIYLIANEPLSEAGAVLAAYQNIATVADVRKLSLAYQGANSMQIYTPTEIPMFLEHLNQSIKVDDPNTIGGEVERTLAKVTLNLNVKDASFPNGKSVVIDHITIKNLPESSSLIAQNYTGNLTDSEKQGADQLMAPVSGYDRSTMNTFYVPEYLFNDPSKGAYIEIIGHFVDGGANREVKYSVKLGNAMGGEPYSDYHITRNHHYTFTGDVKSYGEMDGVEVKVTVAPWTTVNMDEEVGRYVAFDKVTDAAGTTIAEGDNLSDAGTELKVVCNTNTGGWYTVTRNAKGDVVHQSNPTELVSASASPGTSQTVSVTIPKLWELPDLQSYTVSIYPRTIAQESVGPVKELKFTQKREGFIPNEVLIAGGWVNNLPPTGLQIAKRGDSGVAGDDDPRMAWKTTSISTSSTTAPGLGMGASNTDAMAGAEHPAAQYCRDMGEGWFIPSKDELVLIYNNRSALGASYTFYGNYYWSATEYSSTNSLIVNFSFSSTSNGTKTFSYRVRCVKYI